VLLSVETKQTFLERFILKFENQLPMSTTNCKYEETKKLNETEYLQVNRKMEMKSCKETNKDLSTAAATDLFAENSFKDMVERLLKFTVVFNTWTSTRTNHQVNVIDNSFIDCLT